MVLKSKNSFIFKKSILRQYLYFSLSFGILMGIVFRIITPIFVVFKSELLMNIFTTICICAGIMVGCFSYWIGKNSLIKTILNIGEFSQKLSNGDFTTKLNIPSEDEIGDFVNNYNELFNILKKSILAIQNLSIESNTSMQEQMVATTQLTENTQKLSEKYEIIQIETDSNDRKLNYVISQFTILKFSIDNLMIQIDNLAKVIRGVKTSSDESIQKTHIIEQKIQSIESSLSNATLSMEKIATSSKEISTIISVIQSFSDKINLLALNAAIESARAGEDGKGFAVVSDEIAKLANHTRNNIKNINSLVIINSLEVKNGFSAFQSSFESTQELINETKSLVNFFEDIRDSMTSQIENHSDVENEANSGKEISITIQNHLNEYNESFKRVKITLEEMNLLGIHNASSAEELSAASEEIANFTHQLEENTKFFKF
jgi:methyl-accepting chemotaxis protein